MSKVNPGQPPNEPLKTKVNKIEEPEEKKSDIKIIRINSQTPDLPEYLKEIVRIRDSHLISDVSYVSMDLQKKGFLVPCSFKKDEEAYSAETLENVLRSAPQASIGIVLDGDKVIGYALPSAPVVALRDYAKREGIEQLNNIIDAAENTQDQTYKLNNPQNPWLGSEWAIDADYAGQGIMKKLVDNELDYLRQVGCDCMLSGHHELNGASTKLHDANGFQTIGEWDYLGGKFLIKAKYL